jgi:hypothetical protein
MGFFIATEDIDGLYPARLAEISGTTALWEGKEPDFEKLSRENCGSQSEAPQGTNRLKRPQVFINAV